MFSCPIATPASSVPTAVPRLNVPILRRPMKKPIARVKNSEFLVLPKGLGEIVHGWGCLSEL
jgi:hypothetical protein